MPPDPALLQRIRQDPGICNGKPRINNTRLSVELLLGQLSQDVTFQELLEDYPELEPEDLRAGLAYARKAVQERIPAPKPQPIRPPLPQPWPEAMKFLTDHGAGHGLAAGLRERGLDVLPAQALGANAEDAAILAHAVQESRIVIPIDTDFGERIYKDNQPHAGLIRRPDLNRRQRQTAMARLLAENQAARQRRAIITFRANNPRNPVISYFPAPTRPRE